MSNPAPSPPVPVAAPPPATSNTTAPPPTAAPPPPAAAAPPPATQPPPVAAAPPPATQPPPAAAAPPPATTPPTTPSPPPAEAPPGAPPSPPAPQAPPSPGKPPAPPVVTPSPPSRSPPSPPSRSPPTPSTRVSPPPPSNSNSNDNSVALSRNAIIGLAVGGVVILVLVIGLFFCFCRRKPRRKPRPPHHHHDYEAGHYKADYYGPGRDGRDYYGQVKPSTPPPGPPRDYYGQAKPSTPPPPPPHHKYPPPPQGSSHQNSSQQFDSSGSQYNVMPPPPPPPPPVRPVFSYEELQLATNGFSRDNVLGEGGFGLVYKGILTGGKCIAVKVLKAGSGQGEREFRAEVEIISRVHHKHLVSLVGYCIADEQRLLAYEFVPNGTLEQHLHNKGRTVLDWPTRLRIAAGAARGLAYLHEDCHPRIIHRDIKTSNILLDANFEAQVSDFGLAKLASDAFTHVSTRVMGTFGYLAPEYASSGKLTDKSDVFSFGVVLLELITGKRPVDSSLPVGNESLVEWARSVFSQELEDDDLDEIVDPRLPEYNVNEMRRMMEAAAACTRQSAFKRPKMGLVARALESDSAILDLNQGVKPGHSSNFGSNDYDSNQYRSDMKKMRKTALGSQEYLGSEYSEATSEYGLNNSGSSAEIEKQRKFNTRSPETTSSSETNRRINDPR